MQKMDVVIRLYIHFGRNIGILMRELYSDIHFFASVRLFAAFNRENFNKGILKAFMIDILANFHLF
jgi:hypothetical protein